MTVECAHSCDFPGRADNASVTPWEAAAIRTKDHLPQLGDQSSTVEHPEIIQLQLHTDTILEKKLWEMIWKRKMV